MKTVLALLTLLALATPAAAQYDTWRPPPILICSQVCTPSGYCTQVCVPG